MSAVIPTLRVHANGPSASSSTAIATHCVDDNRCSIYASKRVWTSTPIGKEQRHADQGRVGNETRSRGLARSLKHRKTQHLTIVQWLLAHGEHETSVRDYGDRRKEKDESTASHKAVANGAVDIAKLLVGRGADLEAKDPMGLIPLMKAAASEEK
ncbi:MAG: hypothetical protein Q9207_007362 [Kuettlingeria erythrocarpa]